MTEMTDSARPTGGVPVMASAAQQECPEGGRHEPMHDDEGVSCRWCRTPMQLPHRFEASSTAASGVDLIAAERQRQIEQEGYTPEHDRGHASSLAWAAAVYAAPGPATTTATPASGGLASRSGLSAAQAKTLQVGDPVMCWPGERRGTGYLMFLAYEGVHDIGGTKCIYVRPMGGHSRGMALTHCEVPCR